MRYPQAEESVLLFLTPYFFTGQVTFEDIVAGPTRGELERAFQVMTEVHEQFNVPVVPVEELELAFQEDMSERPQSIAAVIQLLASLNGLDVITGTPEEIVTTFLTQPEYAEIRELAKTYSETIHRTLMTDPSLRESFRNYTRSITYRITGNEDQRPETVYSGYQIQVLLRQTVSRALEVQHPELSRQHESGESLATVLVDTMSVEKPEE